MLLKNSNDQTYRRNFLLTNEECTDTTCNLAAAMHTSSEGQPFARRSFQKSSRVTEEFNADRITEMAGDDTVMLVPMDVDEDGRLDIIA